MILYLENGLNGDPLLTIPDDNSCVYKYFKKFEYFEDFICSESLFFSRISKWCDPDEGIIPQDAFYEIFQSLILNYNLSENKKKIYGDYKYHYQLYKCLTHHSYACCFHINEQEEHYMWNEYAGDKCQIAIKTSIGKIKKTFEDNQNQFIIGSIIYAKSQLSLDFLNDKYYRFFYKREKYQKEREFRILLCSPDPYDRMENLYSNYVKPHSKYPGFKEYYLKEIQKAGIDSEICEKITIDLEYLIDEIIIRPFSENDLELKIRTLLNRKICNPSKIKIKKSNLFIV